jgi:hypothetical protein
MSPANNLSRGEGPKGANIATLKGPMSKPINTAKTAAIWIKSLSELILRVLSLDNFKIIIVPMATIRANRATTK